jgi:hypothetical protein
MSGEIAHLADSLATLDDKLKAAADAAGVPAYEAVL